MRAAVAAQVNLVQLREKNLPARTLHELATRAVEITNDTNTRLLVNDRADLARGAGAHGVHLTSNSLSPEIIRQTFGDDFMIGVSTHSVAEARQARDAGADFAVFGPVFETTSKRQYGPPIGLDKLHEAAREVAPFPLFALGGVSLDNFADCLRAGASGIAGISLFADTTHLKSVVGAIHEYDHVF